MSSSSARGRWVAGAVCAALLASLPLFAHRPPVLDLAPQFEQVTLVAPTLGGARPELDVDIVAPNRLGYLPLLAGLALGGASQGHRFGLALALAFAAASVHLLAAARGRSAAAATLATTFLLSSPLYAGFFNFVSGLAALAYWGWELRPERRGRATAAIAATTLLGAALLALAHTLWLVVGGLWVALVVVARRDRPLEIAARAAGAVPVVLATLVWRAGLADYGWRTFTLMMVEPFDRITSLAMWTSLLWGGLRGGVEPLLLVVVALWLAAGVLAARRAGARPDLPLLAAASIFFAIAVFAPDKVDRAILFAWRWAPMAAICVVLGTPEPAIGSRLRHAVAAGALVALVLPSALAWRAFDREEMAGFDEVLAAVPERSGLIGLDFAHRSPRFRVDPYFQMVAYAAVERSARLGFSFTEVGTSLVRQRSRWGDRRSLRHLEYNAEELVPADLVGFDFLFVHGPESVVAGLVEQTGVLARHASAGQWHLLAIEPVSPRRQGAAQPAAGAAPGPAGGGPGPASPPSAPAARQAPQASRTPG